MTSSQDSLAQTGLYSRQSTTFNNAESPSPSMLLQPTRTEQQKKKGIKSSLGKFFSSKKEKGLKAKDSLSSPSNALFSFFLIIIISIHFYVEFDSGGGGAMSPLTNRSNEMISREGTPSSMIMENSNEPFN